MRPIVISDFGGVLTTAIHEAFIGYERQSGIPTQAFGEAIAAISERDGANPLYELEKGHITEAHFQATLGAELTHILGREIDMSGFSEHYFSHLHPNDELIAYMRGLREERGLRLALLTNNVREWEPRWRRMLPVDEIFELVVDSAYVGMRKPEREIYELTLSRLGARAEECVFVDDFPHNCDAARELGLAAVQFRSNEQAIAEIEEALGGCVRRPARIT